MKKINIKLTLSLVSLFLSLMFLVIGNNVKICLSFGFVFLAVAIELFALYRNEIITKSIALINEDMMAEDFNISLEKGYKKERKKLIGQKNKILILFSLLSLCLVVVAIINLF